ncbi:ribonuclease E/G [Anaerobutyricum soehngenii]|uniref:ribonuclease E/G n=1 Tax=Anaerobutyricum soehngenii TaxID=105843 RepID=UPI003A7F29E0
MTVIDVNTGSVLKKKRQEDTLLYQRNREAAKDIASKLCLCLLYTPHHAEQHGGPDL